MKSEFSPTPNIYDLNLLFSLGIAVIITDKQGNIVFANEHIATICRQKKDDILGMDLDSLFPGIEKEVKLKKNKFVLKAPETGTLLKVATKALASKDKEETMLFTFVTLEQITKEFNSEVELRHTAEVNYDLLRQKLQNIIHNTPAILLSVNMDKVFTMVEGKGLTLMDLQPGHMVGESIYKLKYVCAGLVNGIEKAFGGVEIQQTAEAKEMFFQIQCSPVKNSAGEVIEVVTIIQNITAIKESELRIADTNKLLSRHILDRTKELIRSNNQLRREIDERKHYEEKLSHQALELKQKNDDLEKMSLIVSNDLQQPLRTISGNVKLFAKKLKDQVGPEGQNIINNTLEGVEKMRHLLKGLLKYHSIGSTYIPVENVDVKDVLEKVLDKLEDKILEKEIKVSYTPMPVVFSHEKLVEELLFQLVSNAVRYSSSNKPAINISAEYTNNEWLFFVQDNGKGIATKNRNKIFSIFQRIDRRDAADSTGIGLTLCKRIVELHQGKIWFSSAEGKGTIFYFTLTKAVEGNIETEKAA